MVPNAYVAVIANRTAAIIDFPTYWLLSEVAICTLIFFFQGNIMIFSLSLYRLKAQN
jgi:hypothetical protein